MPLKIEACDMVCQPDAVLGLVGHGDGEIGTNEGVLEAGTVDIPGGEENLEGGSQEQGMGGEMDKEGKEGAVRVEGTAETVRKSVGNPDGHPLEKGCSAPTAWLWSRCSKGCTQEMFEEDDCNGIREVTRLETASGVSFV